MIRTRLVPLLSLVLVPGVAAAKTFKEVVDSQIVPLGDVVVTFIYALAFFLFLFGVVRYFFAQGEEGRTKGKQHMLWGIIALVVMFVVWAIVRVLLSVLGSWA